MHTPAEFEGGPKKGTLATLRQERVLRGSGFRTQKPKLLGKISEFGVGLGLGLRLGFGFRFGLVM
jgi:hypothetical protein